MDAGCCGTCISSKLRTIAPPACTATCVTLDATEPTTLERTEFRLGTSAGSCACCGPACLEVERARGSLAGMGIGISNPRPWRRLLAFCEGLRCDGAALCRKARLDAWFSHFKVANGKISSNGWVLPVFFAGPMVVPRETHVPIITPHKNSNIKFFIAFNRPSALMASQNVFWGYVRDSLLALVRYQTPRHVMFW